MNDGEEGMEIRNGIVHEEAAHHGELLVHAIDAESEEDARYPDYRVEEVEEVESEIEEAAEQREGTEQGEGPELGESIVQETDSEPGIDTGYPWYRVEEVNSKIEVVIDYQEVSEIEDRVDSDDMSEYEEDLRTEFEIKIRLPDGRDICQGTYPQNTKVGALKKRVIEEWPQGMGYTSTGRAEVSLMHGGRILCDNDMLRIFRNRSFRGIIILDVVDILPQHYALVPFSNSEASP